ncbi:hypothetical protein WICPIJ_006729 [Wickerhamomyces pijperi]|uniref:Mitochondrial inner membrane i-AAA protease supercomplex subunit MGR3 n=1 Tax=Wickerhamomyces pijperi TaxID=599730 RepID=A0A9P8Q3Q7_WICPI|nr:hypothetical protein WICPIJ_006729 [Wickerhamomyces pijperi]
MFRLIKASNSVRSSPLKNQLKPAAKLISLRQAGTSATQRFSPPVQRLQRPRRSWGRIFLATTGVISLTGFALWYTIFPHHPYSSDVAKELRKALHAELDRPSSPVDYQLALKHYIQAIDLCDEEGLDILSDAYTGIQLKIGEMYERLGLPAEALLTYSSIASTYLAALTTPGRIDDKDRAHYIQKDLRVVVKCVELNGRDVKGCMMLLMTHFIVAQSEVRRRSIEADQLIHSEEAHIENDLSVTKDGRLKKCPEAWTPFRDELFNARDLYVALCLSSGNLSDAVRTKIATTEWMLHADCPPGEILLSQCNLGAIMYLQAEEFEVREFSGVKGGNEELRLEGKAGKERCLSLSQECYESVLSFAKNLPYELRRGDMAVEESIALSTYGLGVIKLHIGDFTSAKNLLRESRLRAKGAGFDDLVTEAERELKKLNQEEETHGGSLENKDRIEQLLQASEQGMGEVPIEMDIQLTKHSATATSATPTPAPAPTTSSK